MDLRSVLGTKIALTINQLATKEIVLKVVKNPNLTHLVIYGRMRPCVELAEKLLIGSLTNVIDEKSSKYNYLGNF